MAIAPWDLIKLTWRSVWSNPVRSGLTTLGVFMGVAAVSATLNIASITNAQIEQKLAAREKPYIIPYLLPKAGFEYEELDEEDAQALERSIPEVRSVSSVDRLFSIRTVQFEGNEATEIQTVGVSQNFIQTTGRRILQGRFFDRADIEEYRPVAVLDQKLATTLFKGENPINQAVYAVGNRLTVIGVIETKSSGGDFERSSGALWIPKTLGKLYVNYYYTTLQISPYRLDQMPSLQRKVRQVLGQRHPQSRVNTYGNAKDLIKEQELQKTSAQALAVVGLVALAIGGVGIANITIAAVLERIQEIGLRRAIGATQLEVMVQFILEAVIFSLVGGTIAIGVVHGLTTLATTMVIQAPYQFSVYHALVSMGAAILVGVGSSFFPALRATQVDVVKALRGD